jgi:hypothetical protein
MHKSQAEFAALVDQRAHEMMQYKYTVPDLVQGILGEDRHFMRKIGHLKLLQVPIPAKIDEKPEVYYLPMLFTQDFVVTLDDYLQQFRMASNVYMRTLEASAIRQLKGIFDQIIQLHFAIWEYGIFEFVFKPENFGMRFSKNGVVELIWMDLAEHITDVSEAERILGERRWMHATMPHKIDYQFLPIILQEYYTSVCDKALTIQNLRRYWRRKSIHAENVQTRKLRLKQFIARTDKKIVDHWVARRMVSHSLREGFVRSTVDDLQIPIQDIELLINDHVAIDDKRASIEEKIERHREETGGGQRVLPLLSPYPLFRNEEQS